MLPLLHARRFALIATLSASALSPAAHAVEDIVLRSGFDQICVKHEAADAGHIKCFTSGENYLQLATSQIVRIDLLPEVLAPSIALTASATAPAHMLTRTEIHELVLAAGDAKNIDPDLIESVIHTESGYRQRAVSRAGARGLMQLMPGTAHDQGVSDVFAPKQNITGGAAYLDALLKLYKDDVAKALAAYNAGPAAVARYHGVPPYRETRAYVARVIKEFNQRVTQRRKTAASSTTALAAAVSTP